MKEVILLLIYSLCFLTDKTESKETRVGPCIRYEEESDDCPDHRNIQLYLFTRSVIMSVSDMKRSPKIVQTIVLCICTKKNRENGQYVEVSESADNLTASHFNKNNPNKLVIHGFNADINLNVLVKLKEEYLIMQDVNVWMVNYSRLVENSWCYIFAVANIGHVGRCLAQLIHAIQRHSTAQLHVVGFSLGAHVANYLANSLGEFKLDRITGLDPAGLLFSFRNNKYKLDASDANFVDILHTNGLMQGTIERSGHVDFFVNGGIQQSGCQNRGNSFLNCNHRRAVEYFTESLRTQVGFYGWPCRTYTELFTGYCAPQLPLALMGEHCSNRSRGYYTVLTADEEPFALGNSTLLNL